MIRQNPTDPACSSAIVGDTKIPEPVNRKQSCDGAKFGVTKCFHLQGKR
jgi:hypothetical protein